LITIKKIQLYERFAGDIDGFSRVGSKSDKELISDSEWIDIRDLLDRIWSELHVPVTEDFKLKTIELLSKKVAYEESIKKLKTMVAAGGFPLSDLSKQA
jgi:hypothetical protein